MLLGLRSRLIIYLDVGGVLPHAHDQHTMQGSLQEASFQLLIQGQPEFVGRREVPALDFRVWG